MNEPGPYEQIEALEQVNNQLRGRLVGLEEQHHRDSAELRRLCAARDEAFTRGKMAFEENERLQERVWELEAQRVPELHNIIHAKATSDQTIQLAFTSCRSASAFRQWIVHHRPLSAPASSQESQ